MEYEITVVATQVINVFASSPSVASSHALKLAAQNKDGWKVRAATPQKLNAGNFKRCFDKE